MTEVITVRHTEPGDYEALRRVYAQPRAIWGTAQLPFPAAETWRKRLAEPPQGFYSLAACAGDEIVGHLGLHTAPKTLAVVIQPLLAWLYATTGRVKVWGPP